MQKPFTIISFLLTSVAAVSQQSVVSSGADVVNDIGSISYSVGQVVYSTNSGISGSISQGVQQPYDVEIISGIENLNVHLQLSVFSQPNKRSNSIAN